MSLIHNRTLFGLLNQGGRFSARRKKRNAWRNLVEELIRMRLF